MAVMRVKDGVGNTACDAKERRNHPRVQSCAPRCGFDRYAVALEAAFELAVAGSYDCLIQVRLSAQRTGKQQNLTLPPAPFPAGGNVDDTRHPQ